MLCIDVSGMECLVRGMKGNSARRSGGGGGFRGSGSRDGGDNSMKNSPGVCKHDFN